MVAAFSQLYHLPTIIASLPALLFPKLENSKCTLIVVAFASSVPFHVAFLADLRLAFFAFTNFASSHFVLADVLWFYPDATAFLWTVKAILCGVFGELPVPKDFELDVEELVNVIQRYLFLCTAPWWHELWIGCGECEDTFET